MKQLVVIFTLWLWMPVGAQKTLTLEECLKLGIENNLSLEGSRNEMRKAKHLLSENRAKLWPQISAVAGFNDNFNPPVSVTDGSAKSVRWRGSMTILIHRYLSPMGRPMGICTM